MEQTIIINGKPVAIVVEETWNHYWQAVTTNYDGPGSPLGYGTTAEQAIAELTLQLEDE